MIEDHARHGAVELRAFERDARQLALTRDLHHTFVAQFSPCTRAASAAGDMHPTRMQHRRPVAQVDMIGADIGAAIARLTIEIEHAVDGCTAGMHPRAHASTHARTVDTKSQVGARNRGIDAVCRRHDREASVDDMQFAESIQRAEGIGIALVLLARQAAHVPRSVRCALEREVESAQAKFGERMAG
ncbi:hypothetical protein ACVWZN_001207 [Lysobacter sp. HA35]